MGPFSPNALQRVIVDPICMRSFPCQHTCSFTFRDGTERLVTLSAPQIKGLIAILHQDQVDTVEDHDHFLMDTICSMPETIRLIKQVYEGNDEDQLEGTSCNKCIIL